MIIGGIAKKNSLTKANAFNFDVSGFAEELLQAQADLMRKAGWVKMPVALKGKGE